MVALPDGFVSLGWHQPADARRLLEALTAAGIQVHAEFDDGITGRSPLEQPLGGFGASASVLVAVEEGRFMEAEAILRDTFGEWLPVELEREPGGHDGGHGDGPDAGPGEWDEAGEIERLQREDRLVGEIRQLERGLRELNDEIRAVEEEIAHRRTPPDRREVLRAAMEQHLVTAEGALAELDRRQEELRELRGGG